MQQSGVLATGGFLHFDKVCNYRAQLCNDGFEAANINYIVFNLDSGH